MKGIKTNRFVEIDFLRGIAVVGMIIFHVFYILDFLQIRNYEMYENGFLALVRFVQLSFLILAGASLAISRQHQTENNIPLKEFYRKRWSKALFIFLCGMAISLVTWIFTGDKYVRFGILHLIGVSIFLLSFLSEGIIKQLILGVIAIILGFIFNEITTQISFLQIFGFSVKNIYALDYFPIFPWIGVIFFGIAVGNILYKNGKRRFGINLNNKFVKINFTRMISFLGQNSLVIYLSHIPIILAITILGIVLFS